MRDRVINTLNHHRLRNNAEHMQGDEHLSQCSLILPQVTVSQAGEVSPAVEETAAEELDDYVVAGDEDLEPEVPLHHALEDYFQLINSHRMTLCLPRNRILMIITIAIDIMLGRILQNFLILPLQPVVTIVLHELVYSVDEEQAAGPV